MNVSRLFVDIGPLRRSPELRSVVLGSVVSGVGSQMVLVALPYQVYVLTGSPLMTGMVGAVGLLPIFVMALYGGSLVDRYDRRIVLLLDQLVLIGITIALALVSLLPSPPVGLLLLLAGVMAGAGVLQHIARAAIIPNLVPREEMKAAIVLHFVLFRFAFIVGPALAGVMITAFGVATVYAFAGVLCSGILIAVVRLRPQRPAPTANSTGRLVAEGLRFVAGNDWLKGVIAIDLIAMTFAMPRALFPVLAVDVFNAGASGTGVLHASVAVGAAVTGLTAGWLAHVSRLGRVLLAAILIWGVAVGLAGFAGSLWFAALMFAVAGGADSIGAACRSAISHTVTPDVVRGRMSSVYTLGLAVGPRAGDMASGSMASLVGAPTAVAAGGILSAAGALLLVARIPALVRYDSRDWLSGDRTRAQEGTLDRKDEVASP